MAAAKTEKKQTKPVKKEVKKGGGEKKQRRNPIRFIKDVWSELKKVTWPSRKELTTSVLAVIGFVAVFTLAIWLMDLALAPLFQWLISTKA